MAKRIEDLSLFLIITWEAFPAWEQLIELDWIKFTKNR